MNRRAQTINDFPQSSSITVIELIEENNPADIDVVADVVIWSPQHSRSTHDVNFRGTQTINSSCQISLAAANEIAVENSQIDIGEVADIVTSPPICSGSNFKGKHISFAGFDVVSEGFPKKSTD